MPQTNTTLKIFFEKEGRGRTLPEDQSLVKLPLLPPGMLKERASAVIRIEPSFGSGRHLSSVLPDKDMVSLGDSVAIREAIAKMAAEEVGLDGRTPDFKFCREASAKLSVASFRKAGLLQVLIFNFGGDIPKAVRSAYLRPEGKPLLFLDGSNPQALWQPEWQQRRDEIEDRILRRRHRAAPKEKNRRGRENNANEQAEEVVWQEAADERRVIFEFVREGDTACQLLGGEEVTTLALLFGQVDRHGKVYYVSSGQRLGERLFERLFALFVNFSNIKGERTKDGIPGIYRLQTGSGPRIFSSKRAWEIANFLSSPYRQDLDFYLGGYEQQDAQARSGAFFARYPLVPISCSPPIPKSIKSGSVDMVIETRGWSRLQEKGKEEFLWETDRILKPGGTFIIKENGRGQAEIEYYGQELFSKYYRREKSKGLLHPAQWMIFRKLHTGELRPPAVVPEDVSQQDITRSEAEGDGKLERRQNLRQAILLEPRTLTGSRGGAIDAKTMDDLSRLLSLKWFKEKGLLPALMTEFGGDIEQVIRFSLSGESPKKKASPESRARQGENAKQFYTARDVARELGVEASLVRTAMRKKGLVSKSNLPGQGKRMAFNQRFSYETYLTIKDIVREEIDRGRKHSN